jgi:hypothetical protein
VAIGIRSTVHPGCNDRFNRRDNRVIGILMAARDYPFRGEFSVTPESFQLLYERMKSS